MRKILWRLLLLMTAFNLLAGNALSIKKSDYVNINSATSDQFQDENKTEQIYFDLNSILEAKMSIAISDKNDQEKIKNLFALYKKSLPFLETCDDYVRLCNSDDLNVAREVNEMFLNHYIERFFDKKPSVQQLNDLADKVDKAITALRLKNYALKLVTNPEDFILTVKAPMYATDGYKKALARLIYVNIDIFKLLKPEFSQVLALETCVLNQKSSDCEDTEKALFAIKKSFAQQFLRSESSCIIDYGSNQLSQSHRNDVAWLKEALLVRDETSAGLQDY